ncbi:hypothetical protein LTR85_006920 [Meristemomyces frigidus]|nr:hypothetical protein LTR85_006920 [Meristemomyces frigidus]
MKSTQAYHNPEFLREVWGLYGVGVAVLVLRSLVRLRTVGLRKFQGDDYIIIFVLFCYTADAVASTLAYQYGTNVDYTPQQLAAFDHEQISNIVFGSKMELFAWYTYTALVWSLKACMLFFYNRLTFGLDVQPYIKTLAVACGVTYLATLLTVTLGCLPIQRNWQISPTPPIRCTLKPQNFYVCTILNVITDAAMLCIPLPILWHLRVPLRRKLALAAMLCSGVFVITAALVRIIMTLSAHPSVLNVNRWGVRETIAGIIAINIPILRPLFRKDFWTGDLPDPDGAPTSHHRNLSDKPSKLTKSQDSPDSFEMIEGAGSISHLTGMKSVPSTTVRRDDHSDLDDDDTASDDFIIQRPDRRSRNEHADDGADLEKGRKDGVRIETTYAVRPTSALAVAGRPDGTPSPHGSDGTMRSGGGWDDRWQHRSFGNSVKIGHDDGMGNHR